MSSFSPIKDIITEEGNKSHILPTLVPYEASSHEQEDEGLNSEDNAHSNKEEGDFNEMEKSDKSTAVLLSEEELEDLLKKETEEEFEAEERALQEEEIQTDKDKVDFGGITGGEEAEVEGKMLDDKPKMEDEVTDEEEDVKVENVEDDEMLVKEEVDVEMVPLEKREEKVVKKMVDSEEQGAFSEDSDGSTESEIPADLDYAADSGLLQPLQIVSARKHDVNNDKHPLSKTALREKETSEKGLPIIEDDFEPDLQNMEAVDSGEMSDQVKDSEASKEISAGKKEKESNADIQKPRGSTEFEIGSRVAGKEEDESKNDSGSHTNRKTRRQKKNQRARKHSPQNEDPPSEQEQSQQVAESDGSSTDNTVHKAKRRRAGKWVMKLFL